MMDVERASRDDLIAYIDRLEGENAALRAAAEPELALVFQERFGLTPLLARLLVALADGRPHSRERLLNRLYADRIDEPPNMNIVGVLVCRLRDAVWQDGIEIETIWGSGYRIVAGREALEAERDGRHLAPRPAPAPQASRRRPTRRPVISGAVEKKVLCLLERMQGDIGPSRAIEISMPEIKRRAGLVSPPSQFVQQLQRKGRLAVLRMPQPGDFSGAPWKIRVLDPGAIEKGGAS